VKTFVVVLMLGCGVAVAKAVTPDAVSSEDYAWRFPVRLEAQSDVHVLTLTPEIYRSMFDPGLGDLRLVAGDGREISFGPLPAPPMERWRETPWAMQKVGVIYQPIRDEMPQAFPATNVELEDESFGLKLRQGEYAAHATLKLRSNARQSLPIRALRIEWSASGDLPEGTRWWVESGNRDDSVVLPDRVSTRYDASSGRGESRLIFLAQDLIELHELRVHVQAVPSGLSFDATFAEYEPDPDLYRHSVLLTPFQFRDLPEHSHGFALDGPYPVHAVAIELAAGDALASVHLFARDMNAPWWQDLGSATAFDVKVDRAQFERGRIIFEPTRNRQWLLRSTPALTAPPRLHTYYRPDQFLIAHRGPDELTLFAGHRTARRQHYPVEPLIHDLRNRLGDHWQPEAARLGARFEVKGNDALKAPPPSPPYRKWALWIALVLGAAMIAWMAMSLLNESRDVPE